MKMTVIPIVINAFGTVLKGLERGGKELKMTVETNINRRIWDGPQWGGKRTDRIEMTAVPIVIEHLGRSSKGWKRIERIENDGDTNSNRRIWDGLQMGGKRTERIENDGDTNSNRRIWDGPQRGGKRTERIENDGDTNSNRRIWTVRKGVERGRKELKMTVIPIVIDAFGTVCNGVERGRKELKITVIPIVIEAFGTVRKGWKEDGKNRK